MKDQYVGDVGDYAKYSLFRALRIGRKAGVAWYHTPDDGTADGGKRAYLSKPEWADHDPEVFALMRDVQVPAARSLAAIERSRVMTGVVFSRRQLSFPGASADRSEWRKAWFEETLADLADRDFILIDPDTGLRMDESFRPSLTDHLKYLPLAEAKALAAGRAAMIYHHHPRAANVTEFWLARLRPNAFAVRFDAESASRSFFVLNPSADMRIRAGNWAQRWPTARFVE